MANKIKRIIPNNLLEIRTSLGYTQEKMGEILGVGVRTICNYEIGATNLPPDKAMTLYEEYGYSFDYIYANVKESNSKIDAFLVDIRDLIVLKDDKIYFQIPDSYWDYIYKLSEIKNSIDTNQSKNNKKLELDAKYIDDSNNHSYRASFSKEELIRGLIRSDEFVACCNEKESIKYHEKSKITNQHIEKEDDNIICKAVIPKSNFLKYFCDTPFGDDKNQNKTRRTPTKNEIKEVVELLEDTGEEETRKIKIKL